MGAIHVEILAVSGSWVYKKVIDNIKNICYTIIHKALDLSKKGYISVDEAIKIINEN